MVFFEKKNQKTLASSQRRPGVSAGNKSFLLLFFKKKGLSS
jgi:hypothetical protein